MGVSWISLFPLIWQYRFLRDFALRGQDLSSMLVLYGALLMYVGVIALFIVLRFSFMQRKLRLQVL